MGSPTGSHFITTGDRIRHWQTGHRWRSGATALPARSAKGCGYDAALGQRWRVAHIPTATTTAKGSRSVMILGGRSGALPINKPAPVAPPMGSTSVRLVL